MVQSSILYSVILFCSIALCSCSHEANSYHIKGIDVSHYQRKIDWQRVAPKVDFVFVKSSEAVSYQDSFFVQNWQSLKQYGVPRGAYHFFRPRLSADAQAANFIETVTLESGDLPPILDVETLDGINPKDLIPKVALWLELIEQHYEVKPMLYTSVKFYQDFLQPHFPNHPIWIARYNRKSPPIEAWQFWQYTAHGKMDGVKGDLDLNVFSGSRKDFEQLLLP